MVAEVSETGENAFEFFEIQNEEMAESWNGRRVDILEDTKEFTYVASKLWSMIESEERSLDFFNRTNPRNISQKGWNHDCFPTPPTKPILSPVPDGDTAVRYAYALKNALLTWIEEEFVNKDLMTVHNALLIEKILIRLVNEVENYNSMRGLYNRDVDWKEVLHPLHRLYQFWKNKWDIYKIPPHPQDYPLP